MRGRWLTLGTAVGPALFALAWIVLGVMQPAVRTPYGVLGGISGAISNPISGLGVGTHVRALQRRLRDQRAELRFCSER